MKDVLIRREESADFRETENVLREAFWNFYAPGCIEHYVLHVLRGSADFVPELDLVAVFEGKIIGSIAYVRSAVAGDDGVRREVLCLGPIGVLPDYQRRGVGGMLTGESRRIAAEMGFKAIFLYGDPEYYSRYGFGPAEKFGVRTVDGMYVDALQAYELVPGALAEILKLKRPAEIKALGSNFHYL